jgi:hypothetical protein
MPRIIPPPGALTWEIRRDQSPPGHHVIPIPVTHREFAKLQLVAGGDKLDRRRR